MVSGDKLPLTAAPGMDARAIRAEGFLNADTLARDWASFTMTEFPLHLLFVFTHNLYIIYIKFTSRPDCPDPDHC
jgi:hypothetical protein